IVSTDGFRLSFLKEKQKGDFSNMIIPANFLHEIVKNAKDVKNVSFVYSKKENIVLFKIENEDFYSRLIDGEFPPYERVIPSEKKTTVELNRDELLRNTKLISIFARDYSNVIIYEFSKNGLTLRPKEEGNKENATLQEIVFEGEDQTVAFNFRYVVDFLNNIKSEEIIIELLRPDAPVVFKAKGNEQFFHIIMPIRIQN
ncbi:MAG TPA: DNA polymerase III subunit beta, partial [Candidatus Woesebacteria bacterium]|nr:DNA polymerase III subunit beta [Candidatus Woesebacteria bacterium]